MEIPMKRRKKMSNPEYTVGVWDMTFYKIDPETNEPLLTILGWLAAVD